MSLVYVSRIIPSKFGDGDRWRLEIDGEWYDAYLTPDAASIQAGDHEVEFKTSPKTGKHYIVAVDGRYRTGGGQRPAPAPRPVPGSAPRPAAAPAAPMPAETKPGQKDMWIMATSICQAVIQRFESWQHGELVDLAREAANAARAAARVFDGARVDEARSALSPPPRPAAPEPEGDPGDPRNTGPDFDDDIPF